MDGLSDRETEILTLVAAGMRLDQVAERLSLSAGTVKVYAFRLRAKLGAVTLAHAVRIALVRGLICTCAAEDEEVTPTTSKGQPSASPLWPHGPGLGSLTENRDPGAPD